MDSTPGDNVAADNLSLNSSCDYPSRGQPSSPVCCQEGEWRRAGRFILLPSQGVFRWKASCKMWVHIKGAHANHSHIGVESYLNTSCVCL